MRHAANVSFHSLRHGGTLLVDPARLRLLLERPAGPLSFAFPHHGSALGLASVHHTRALFVLVRHASPLSFVPVRHTRGLRTIPVRHAGA